MKFIRTFMSKLAANHPMIRHHSSKAISNKIFSQEAFITGRKNLLEHNYEEAAKSYRQWYKQENIFDKIKLPSLSSEFKNEFIKYLPNILKAFLGCPRDVGCKYYIKEIVSNDNLYSRVLDKRGDTVFHLAAAYPSATNNKVYTDLFSLLNTKEKTDILFKKNLAKETPIEVAFLHGNKEFIKLAKKICHIGLQCKNPQKCRI